MAYAHDQLERKAMDLVLSRSMRIAHDIYMKSTLPLSFLTAAIMRSEEIPWSKEDLTHVTADGHSLELPMEMVMSQMSELEIPSVVQEWFRDTGNHPLLAALLKTGSTEIDQQTGMLEVINKHNKKYVDHWHHLSQQQQGLMAMWINHIQLARDQVRDYLKHSVQK